MQKIGKERSGDGFTVQRTQSQYDRGGEEAPQNGAYQGKRSSPEHGKTKRGASEFTERQRLFSWTFAGSVFVLLVAVKLLLPGRMAALNATLSDALQQNMDLQAVFSAVGRTFSGEEDWTGAAEEVYRAVFEPEAGEALETAAHSGIELKERAPGEAALDRLHTYSQQDEETPAEDSTPEQQVSTLAYILYSDQNLPENVSLEQAILGFDYCTPISGTHYVSFWISGASGRRGRAFPLRGGSGSQYWYGNFLLCRWDREGSGREQQLWEVLYC